jgi:hypothetical protein
MADGGFGGHVNVAAPIDVAPEDNPTSEPEPDLIVLRPEYADPWKITPQAQDVLLAVEVSDMTFEFDSTVKGGLYGPPGVLGSGSERAAADRASFAGGRALPVDRGLRGA